MRNDAGLSDVFSVALEMARDLTEDRAGIVGYGVVELFGPDGERKLARPFANLITDYGDSWYAAKGITAIPPASPAAPTALTGMQIGTSATAVAKNGAGSGMVGSLLSGKAFDGSYPQVNDLGAGLGDEAVFKTTYNAGEGTGTVEEATITNGTIGVASVEANTISRILTGTIVKGAGDSLAITWRHKFLGA